MTSKSKSRSGHHDPFDIQTILCCAFISDPSDMTPRHHVRGHHHSHNSRVNRRDNLASHNRDQSHMRLVALPSNHRHTPAYAGRPGVSIKSKIDAQLPGRSTHRNNDPRRKEGQHSSKKLDEELSVDTNDDYTDIIKLAGPTKSKTRSSTKSYEKPQPALVVEVHQENIVNNRNALFAELNQGDGYKAHLKHLTKEEKDKRRAAAKETHGVVQAREVPVAAVKKKPVAAVVKKDPVRSLIADREWTIQNQEKDILTITKDEIKFRHSIVVRDCVGTTIILEGKCSNLLLDNCTAVSVIFNGAMSGCEVIRSVKCNVQIIEGMSPAFTLDRADNLNIYLNEASRASTSFTYSLCSGINIWFPSADDPEEMISKPLPDQFKAVLNVDNIEATPSDLYM